MKQRSTGHKWLAPSNRMGLAHRPFIHGGTGVPPVHTSPRLGIYDIWVSRSSTPPGSLYRKTLQDSPIVDAAAIPRGRDARATYLGHLVCVARSSAKRLGVLMWTDAMGKANTATLRVTVPNCVVVPLKKAARRAAPRGNRLVGGHSAPGCVRLLTAAITSSGSARFVKFHAANTQRITPVLSTINVAGAGSSHLPEAFQAPRSWPNCW